MAQRFIDYEAEVSGSDDEQRSDGEDNGSDLEDFIDSDHDSEPENGEDEIDRLESMATNQREKEKSKHASSRPGSVPESVRRHRFPNLRQDAIIENDKTENQQKNSKNRQNKEKTIEANNLQDHSSSDSESSSSDSEDEEVGEDGEHDHEGGDDEPPAQATTTTSSDENPVLRAKALRESGKECLKRKREVKFTHSIPIAKLTRTFSFISTRSLSNGSD